MKLINLTILSILAEAMIVNGAAINPENCSQEALPKESQDDEKWTWDKTGGTRMFMNNVPVEENDSDTRLLMPNFAIDPTADYSENVRILEGSTPNVPVQQETPEVAETEILPGEKKTKLAELGKILDTTRVQMERTVSGDKVDLEKYLPLRKAFFEAYDQIKKLDTERTEAFVLQNYSRVPPRIDYVAKAMCEKDPSKAGCESV